MTSLHRSPNAGPTRDGCLPGSAMNIKASRIASWLWAPTDLELAVLYLLLGFYIAVATDAVISLVWFHPVVFSVLGVGLLIAIRVVTLYLGLLAKAVKKFWARWTQLGLIASALILIFVTNLDLSIRVWLSESALREEVQHIQSLPPRGLKAWLGLPPKPVGLFNVQLHEVDVGSGTIWFHTTDGENLFAPPFSIWGGIVYCKQGQPPERGETTYQHLYGPWWRMLQDM